MPPLSDDFSNFTGLDRGDGCGDAWDQRPQILDAVANVRYDDSGNADFGEILLITQLAVRCDNDCEPGADSRTQQNAVFEAKPSLLVYRDRIAAR
jgi:hypothetical protein